MAVRQGTWLQLNGPDQRTAHSKIDRDPLPYIDRGSLILFDWPAGCWSSKIGVSLA